VICGEGCCGEVATADVAEKNREEGQAGGRQSSGVPCAPDRAPLQRYTATEIRAALGKL